MGKSISTTSNTQTTATLATFKAGDAVLCPSVGFAAYKLFNDKEYGCLGFTLNSKTYHYRDDGKVSRDDALPSLFQDTPANRQAIATLYNGRFATQDSQRKVIDTTEADDNIVVTMSSHDLNHIAGDICGAANALHDVGYLLGLIYYGKIEGEAVKSMARLSHDATSTWAEILYAQLDIINEPLAMTGYSKVGAE